MIFHKQKTGRNTSLITRSLLPIDKCHIDRVKSVKFLGILINNNLNWQNHIDLVTDKFLKIWNPHLKLVSSHFNKKCLTQFYFSFIHSYI